MSFSQLEARQEALLTQIRSKEALAQSKVEECRKAKSQMLNKTMLLQEKIIELFELKDLRAEKWLLIQNQDAVVQDAGSDANNCIEERNTEVLKLDEVLENLPPITEYNIGSSSTTAADAHALEEGFYMLRQKIIMLDRVCEQKQKVQSVEGKVLKALVNEYNALNQKQSDVIKEVDTAQREYSDSINVSDLVCNEASTLLLEMGVLLDGAALLSSAGD